MIGRVRLPKYGEVRIGGKDALSLVRSLDDNAVSTNRKLEVSAKTWAREVDCHSLGTVERYGRRDAVSGMYNETQWRMDNETRTAAAKS